MADTNSPECAVAPRALGAGTRGAAAAFILLSLSIAGCSTDHSGTESGNGATNGAGAAPHTTVQVNPIDACSLLSPDDISALLGVRITGKPTGADPKEAGCSWENPANYESVSVHIGGPDTALKNTLPTQDPAFPAIGTAGPDGMRFLGGGQVEFPAENRSNTVQVAVLSMSADQANAAAVSLARKIAPKIAR